ncbi:plasma membrane fusion protein prm1 [Neonectria punicea]|uniref:Plasma membrane fusion protein PRM1 n=1 Tax=Neonectria punicea TaxID=979145 RepID=A0ABR1GP85_9HYPO
MFFSRKHDDSAVYPAVPDSLRTDSFEMTEMRKTQEARADTAPTFTPYLSLRSRLSQIWLNRWTTLLLLVLVRVLLLITELNDNVGDAKTKALSACTKVEDIGSAMASMPHYLSLGVNEMAASGIEKSIEAMVFMLDLVITGVEAMIVFYINFLTATYTCLITAMIHGSLDVVADVTEDATKSLNDLIDKVVKEIDSIAGDLEDGINKVAKDIEDSVFGDILPDIPEVDFSAPVKDLKDFDLDAKDFVKDVRKLNDDLPTFEEVQNLTKEAISIPFDLVRNLLNETYGDYKFDRDVFPLAQKQELSFCSDNDTINGFFTDLFELIKKAKTIFLVVLILLAVLAIVPMAWLEIKRWRREQQHARLIAKNAYDPLDVVYIASRPMTATWGIKIASRFKGKRQILVRWCIAYATSGPALFVLSLALAGFFSCFCQWLLIRAVKDEVPALAAQVGDFADNVVQTLESVSDDWATDANSVVKGLNDDINNDVLGYVTNATDAVNDTLTTFLDTMDDGLETVFNGTILLNPIKTVLHCVIGIKVESVQKGLTWVHDNAHVNFPLFDNNTFSLGAKDSINGDSDLNTFLASPSSVTTDEVTGAVKSVTDWLHNRLIQEALISTGLILLYFIVVLFGVARTLAGMATPDRGRAEGGMRYTGDDRPAMSPRMGHDGFEAEHTHSATFPRFGSSSGEDVSQTKAPSMGGEKFMSGATGGRATQVDGHQRSSSYGRFDSTAKY